LCSHAGPSPANWTHIHSVSHLIKCDEPLLFDLNVQNDKDGPDSILTLRACMVEGDHGLVFSSQDVRQAQEGQDNTSGDNSIQPLLVSTGCGAKTSEISVTYQVGGSADFNKRSSTLSQPKTEDVASAAHNLGMFMDSGAQCGATILFAKSGSAVVGLYSGAEVTKKGAKGFLDSFVELLNTVSMDTVGTEAKV
jgi:chitinase